MPTATPDPCAPPATDESLSRRARRRAARRQRSGVHDPRTYAAMLRQLVLDAGASFVGITDAEPLLRARNALEVRRDAGLADDMHFTYGDPLRATTPGMHVAEARSILVAALSYADVEPTAQTPGDAELRGRVARYARRDYYGALRDALRVAARQLHRDGYRATVFADDNAMVDREVAYKAGIGWFGKNANLLVPGAGSWFVLGCLVTDAELAPHDAPLDNGCGTCRRCIVACPTQAIVADGVIDARRCLAWIMQKPGSIDHGFRRAIGARMYGCDDCQEVCPPSVRMLDRVAQARDATNDVMNSATNDVMNNATERSDDSVPLVALLDESDDDVMRRVDRWYVSERNPRWVRRNALVVLGNVATAHDHDAVAVVRRYAQGSDELLAEHAQWALAEIERR